MRIVHAVTMYDLLTGSGLYVYELARLHASRGHEVTVVADYVGGELTARTRALGVEVVPTQDLPTRSPDLVHVHQREPGTAALQRWPAARVVATVHSEWPGDAPLLSPRVHTYIAIRPTVERLLQQRYGIPRERRRLILNGVDRERFRPPDRRAARGRRRVLFAATMSPLRGLAVADAVRRSVEEDFDLVLLGLGEPDVVGPLPSTVEWERREEWHVEDYVAASDEVISTFFGRSAIEGWMCGRPAWIYDIVPFERIASREKVAPPPDALLSMCDARVFADQVEDVYQRAVACDRP
jgi:glycosyltransferase involved in cell wall biosynthesis